MTRGRARGRGRVSLSTCTDRYREGGDNAACRARLRDDFAGRCAYCLWHDSRARRDFEIDHFDPRSRGGSNAYRNLRYVCDMCNGLKGNFPTAAQKLSGRRILDPCAEWDYVDHLAEGDDGAIDALTAEGQFHRDRLRLESPRLRDERRLRSRKIARCAELRLVLWNVTRDVTVQGHVAGA